MSLLKSTIIGALCIGSGVYFIDHLATFGMLNFRPSKRAIVCANINMVYEGSKVRGPRIGRR